MGRPKGLSSPSRMQARLIEMLPKCRTLTEAAKKAGYSDAASARRAMDTLERKMPEVLRRHGLTPDYLVGDCLKPGLEAMETKFFAHNGEVIDSVDVVNWMARHKYLDTALQLSGAYPKEEKANIGIIFNLDGHTFSDAVTVRPADLQLAEPVGEKS